jgi:uncharacterized membrane protein
MFIEMQEVYHHKLEAVAYLAFSHVVIAVEKIILFVKCAPHLVRAGSHVLNICILADYMGFGMFELFDTMFWIVFITIFVIIVAFWVFFLWGIVKGRKTQDQTSYEVQPIVKEKEVIREVVKIRCSYCGNLYDENQNKCPYCGANR